MRATHACLVLFQLFALSDGQCACITATPAENSTVSTTAVASTTTTQAPLEENITDTAGNVTSNVTTTTAPTTVTTDAAEVTSSSGPSSGPGDRLLRGMYVDDDYDSVDVLDRQLQDNVSDGVDNVTDGPTATVSQTTMAPTTTSAADSCECPPPQVESTFTATLSLASSGDLPALDLYGLKTELASDQSWGDSVVMVPVVKVGIQYTFDVDVTEAQCKAAVAVAYSMSPDIDITEDDVECGDASSAPAPASAPASAPAAAPSPAPAPFLSPASGPAPAPASAPAPAPAPEARRLQTVKDVTISFTDTSSASAAVTASQDVTHLTTALAAEGVVADVSVSEDVAVSVELTFTVTAEAAIVEPTAEHLQSAVTASSTSAITVTAAITAVEVSFTRMPCSESTICGAGFDFVANSATIGCAGAVCTAEEREICCTVTSPVQAGAQGQCVFGLVFSLLVWHSL